jgi:hypothetical protein
LNDKFRVVLQAGARAALTPAASRAVSAILQKMQLHYINAQDTAAHLLPHTTITIIKQTA